MPKGSSGKSNTAKNKIGVGLLTLTGTERQVSGASGVRDRVIENLQAEHEKVSRQADSLPITTDQARAQGFSSVYEAKSFMKESYAEAANEVLRKQGPRAQDWLNAIEGGFVNQTTARWRELIAQRKR